MWAAQLYTALSLEMLTTVSVLARFIYIVVWDTGRTVTNMMGYELFVFFLSCAQPLLQ